MKVIITMIKVLWVLFRNPPDKDFVYELYLRENAKYYKRHAGIGNGPRDVPDGKFIRSNTRSI